jgi:hypothetical protein
LCQNEDRDFHQQKLAQDFEFYVIFTNFDTLIDNIDSFFELTLFNVDCWNTQYDLFKVIIHLVFKVKSQESSFGEQFQAKLNVWLLAFVICINVFNDFKSFSFVILVKLFVSPEAMVNLATQDVEIEVI